MRPQPVPDYSGMSRSQALHAMYTSRGNGSYTSLPIRKENIVRGLSLVTAFGGGPITLVGKVFVVQPLKHMVYDYLGNKLDPQSHDVVYDKCTESILAEVMSSQQTESRRESAPRFIRPKKRKKIIYE